MLSKNIDFFQKTALFFKGAPQIYQTSVFCKNRKRSFQALLFSFA